MADLVDFDKEMFEDVGFITAMNMVLMGNYAQTGHFGGPLSYTPANVALHLGLPENGGLAWDVRNPKHPMTDKFMLCGGHCIPTCYSLWMVMYEAMQREFEATSDARFEVDPKVGMYAIDALGFRRTQDAVDVLLEQNGLADDDLFAQAKVRGIRALMGHSETTDVTNDCNGGPSGVAAATSAGKAMFWDFVGAGDELKVWALEGEFAFTEGHAQELKTVALAQQVGKRLRLFFSYNNAGIDDALVGGVVDEAYADSYTMVEQFTSYGWNVFELEAGADYEQLLATFKKIEEWPAEDKRPIVVIAHTVKGWWPAVAEDGTVNGTPQLKSYPSHPYAIKTNSSYFVDLATTFEERFGVTFEGIRDGAPTSEADRLRQFKRNIDICLSVLDANEGRLRSFIANRLVDIADRFAGTSAALTEAVSARMDVTSNPFNDERLKVANLPEEPVTFTTTHPTTGETKETTVTMFLPAGTKKGTRRAVSEFGKWLNYVSGNRYITVAADLSSSINLENSTLTGHYSPLTNPQGTRLKAGIQEAANAATVCGLVTQNVSENPDTYAGVLAATGTYGAFTPLFYLPFRILSQQNQESPFAVGVATVVVGHSGPETAADARSHFGIFAPNVWRLFPTGHIINLYMADYNDVCASYFAALDVAMNRKETALIAVHCARPDVHVFDRSTFADSDIKAAAKGVYVIRDYAPDQPKHGVVITQGCSSTVNVVAVIPQLEEAGINVKIINVVSEELFDVQSPEYQAAVLSDSDRLDAMVVTTSTRNIFPLRNLGPLTREYTLASDWDDSWRTGGLEPDVIAEAKLDTKSIFEGISRFAGDRDARIARLNQALAGLQ